MNKISSTIKKLRIQHHMSQDELAEKLFVTRQTISNYETNRSHPDIDTLEKLADIFQVDLETIIYGQSKNQSIKKYIIGLIVVFITFFIFLALESWETKLMHTYFYSYGFRFYFRTFGYGILIIFASYFITRMVLQNHKIHIPFQKYIFYVVLGLCILFVLISIPVIVYKIIDAIRWHELQIIIEHATPEMREKGFEFTSSIPQGLYNNSLITMFNQFYLHKILYGFYCIPGIVLGLTHPDTYSK